MNNQCVTIISISTFFAILFLCSCGAVIYRCFQKFCVIEDIFEDPPPAEQQHNESKEEINIVNPIQVSLPDEDPC